MLVQVHLSFGENGHIVFGLKENSLAVEEIKKQFKNKKENWVSMDGVQDFIFKQRRLCKLVSMRRVKKVNPNLGRK